MTGDPSGGLDYWSVDVPGLSKASAQRLVEWAERENLTTGAHTVDPQSFLSMHLDPETVQALSKSLHIALLSGELAPVLAPVVLSMSEYVDSWLEDKVADVSPEG